VTSGPRRATIHEVARAAGVSATTVSRYLRSGGEGLKQDTLERVRAAVAELDFRPNLAARAMRTRRSGRVAVLLPPGIAASSLRMLTGASAAAHAAGYEVEVITVDGATSVRQVRVVELADSGLYEGVLTLTTVTLEGQGPIAAAAPIVEWPEYDAEMRGIGEVADASPVAELIEGLAQQGHKTFLHITGDRSHATARSRERVYLETIERLGLTSAGVTDGDWSPRAARKAVLDLPADSPVTAIIAANDVLASAAIHAAGERGWKVPTDLSITGWDNNPLGEWLSPTLTTVDVDYEELGRRAMSRLVAVVRDESAPLSAQRVAQVVWRGSTSAARTISGPQR